MTTIVPEELESAIDEKLDEQQTKEVTAEETAAEETKPEPPTIAELEHTHLEEIKRKNADVREAAYEWEQAKSAANSKKKRYESLSEQLQDLIAEDPRQHRLPFGDDQANAVNDAWKPRPITELGLTKGLNKKLEELRITTLGDLQAFWDSGENLIDNTGWGEEKAAKVADAFADYGATHPELFGDADEPEATKPGEVDWNASLFVLGLDERLLKRLEGHDMNSLAELREFWSNDGHLTGFPDVTPEESMQVADAYAEHMASFDQEETESDSVEAATEADAAL